MTSWLFVPEQDGVRTLSSNGITLDNLENSIRSPSFVERNNVTDSLPKPKQKTKQQKQSPRLENNISRLQYQTIAGFTGAQSNGIEIYTRMIS